MFYAYLLVSGNIIKTSCLVTKLVIPITTRIVLASLNDEWFEKLDKIVYQKYLSGTSIYHNISYRYCNFVCMKYSNIYV